MDPGLLKILPSGVGVYLNTFTDIYGSRIIFAGRNKVFTRANKEQLRDSYHAVYVFDTRERMMENDVNLHKKEIRFDSTCKIKTSLKIEDEILQEMGVEPGLELEKLVDIPGFWVNFLFGDKDLIKRVP